MGHWVFSDFSDSIGFSAFSSFSKTDLILDFVSGKDKINLSGLDFDSIMEGKGSSSSAHGLEFYFDGNGNTIIDDPNSNFAIKLAGEIHLGEGDFIM